MSTTLDEALAEVLTKATETVGTGVEAVLTEAPEVAMQALTYYGIYYLVKMVAGIAAVYSIKLTYDLTKTGTFIRWDEASTGAVWLAPVIAAAVEIEVAYCLLNLEWLKIAIAPKLWLLEAAASGLGR